MTSNRIKYIDGIILTCLLSFDSWPKSFLTKVLVAVV